MEKIKILANDGISDHAKKELESSGFFVSTTKVEQDKLADEINEKCYKVLLVRSATKVRAELIDRLNCLELIGRGGVGLDNIDVSYAQSKGIEVFNTPNASSDAVAELVVGSIFTANRYLHNAFNTMPLEGTNHFKSLKKQCSKGTEVRGKVMGIVGSGRIAKALASYTLGLGMKVVIHSRTKQSIHINMSINGETFSTSLNTVTKDELLERSDYISLHVPSEAGKIFSYNDYLQMKDGVCIVNTARGESLDEKDIIQLSEENINVRFILDVFKDEPNPSSKLLNLPSVLAMPHIGAATKEAQDRIGLESAKKLKVDIYEKILLYNNMYS